VGRYEVFGRERNDSFLAITLARQVSSRAALEVTVGQGGEGTRYRGLHAGAGTRLTLAARELGALTAGLGGHVAFLSGFGAVGFGHLDLAWELRTRSGLNLVAGGGASVVLNDSRRVRDGCSVGDLFRCNDRFEQGSQLPWLRLELGWAF